MEILRTRWEHEGAIAMLELDRPPVNAFDVDLLAKVRAALQGAVNNGARVIIFGSCGRHFSAGADIRMVWSQMQTPAGTNRMVAFAQDMQTTWSLVDELGIPTIAAIEGAATGGGLELALACDLRVASARATLGLPEAKLGLLAAAGGTQRLTRLVGPGVAKRLLLSAELVSGEQAHALGIVEFVTAPGGALTTALELGHRIAEQSPAALAAVKRCVTAASLAVGLELEIQESRRLHHEPEARARLANFLQSINQNTDRKSHA